MLYNKFNVSEKDISLMLNCTRPAIRYYIQNHENKKKYNAVRYNVLLEQLNKILDKYKL